MPELNDKPVFIAVPRNDGAKVITGSTDADGSGATVLFQAHAVAGSLVRSVSAHLTGTIATSTVLRLFVKIGSVYYIIAEAPVPIYTQAAGAPALSISLLDYSTSPFLDPVDRHISLNNTDALAVSVLQTIESAIHVVAFGGDFLST